MFGEGGKPLRKLREKHLEQGEREPCMGLSHIGGRQREQSPLNKQFLEYYG